MSRQVSRQALGWAGMSDVAQAGPRALSWDEVGSWALEGAVMGVDWGCYSLYGPWEFGLQTGGTHQSIPDWLRLSGISSSPAGLWSADQEWHAMLRSPSVTVTSAAAPHLGPGKATPPSSSMPHTGSSPHSCSRRSLRPSNV